MSYRAYVEETRQANGVVRHIVEEIGAGMDSAGLLKVAQELLAYSQWLHHQEAKGSPPPTSKKRGPVASLLERFGEAILDGPIQVSLEQVSDKQKAAPEETQETKRYRGNFMGANTEIALGPQCYGSELVQQMIKLAGYQEVAPGEPSANSESPEGISLAEFSSFFGLGLPLDETPEDQAEHDALIDDLFDSDEAPTEQA